MRIKNYTTRNVATLFEKASLYEAARLMKEKNIGSVIIVKDEEKIATGILTDRDIMISILSDKSDLKQIPVGDVSTKDLLVIHQDEDIQDVIKALTDKGVRRAPVVDDDNKVVGIITVDDLLLLMTEKLCSVTEIIKKQIE